MNFSGKYFLPVVLSGVLGMTLTGCIHDTAEEAHTEHTDDTIALSLGTHQVVDNSTAHNVIADGGTASFEFHETEEKLTGSVTFIGTPPDALHIHSGYAGQTGSVVITLAADATNAAVFTIPEEQADAIDGEILKAGGYYLNAHYADGTTLRAQITTEGTEFRVVRLQKHENVTNTAGSGFAGVTINTQTREVTAYVSIKGLTDIVADGVHIHIEDDTTPTPQTTQKIVLEVDNTATGTVYKSPSVLADRILLHEAMDDIAAGRWYINVHTSTNPDGELKGSLDSIAHH